MDRETKMQTDKQHGDELLDDGRNLQHDDALDASLSPEHADRSTGTAVGDAPGERPGNEPDPTVTGEPR